MKKDITEAWLAGDEGTETPLPPLPDDDGAETGRPRPPRKLADILRPAIQKMRDRASGKEKPIPMPPNWGGLSDELHHGWWPGEQYILVGNTGQGKTSFALQAALHAAKEGCPVVYVPLEMDDTQIAARLLGNHTGHPWSSLLYGGTDINNPQVDEFERLVEGWHLYVCEVGPIDDLEYQVGSVRLQVGPAKPMLVVLDFLQLVSMDGQDLRGAIRRAAYQGTKVARECNAAVLMLSSTSREHYQTLDENIRKDSNKRVAIGDEDECPSALVGLGKESGEIEYSAHNLLVLCKSKKNGGFLALSKRRTGKPTWLLCKFDGPHGTFTISASEDGATEHKTDASPQKASKYA